MSFMFFFLFHFCSLSFRAGTITTAEALYTMTFTHRVEGRYVTVRIPGEGKVLTLCEVEVYGYHAPTEENLAIQGKAAQSSLYSFYSPYYAIDGSRDSKFDDGSKITNRYRVPERINGAEIRIGDSLVNNGADNPRFAVITSIPSGETAEFQVPNGMDGRYVYIGITGRQEYLTLCEVEVFGSALD
ncbi:Fucolectin-1 [Dissostichus eleginoides]|uniref:Fucolectin-1 n=1 Tax=Dissostichus eleginoides TaxID=100907 RepID=A0AAD9EXC9_DISEL|nr:Fucolectin-1 [Dissostichus eleginoides]